ncbi:MAG: GTP-binding protein [Methanomassiliicoccales archaeon]|nr:MAG: GTP-binding protein [Methanomassiliicoccales archaeon]
MKIKICLAGDARVGKTSLIGRYVHDVFGEKYLSTLGTKVSRKEISLEYPERETEIKMEALIWDIMGQKNFRKLFSEKYFNGANGIIGVCDLTDEQSLKSLYEWINTARRFAGDVPVILLANKNDLIEEIKLRPDDLQKTASDLGFGYLLTSAKTGENVPQAFLTIGKEIVKIQFGLD